MMMNTVNENAVSTMNAPLVIANLPKTMSNMANQLSQ